MEKNNQKGFTLVEVIVVLVILVILAAIAVPSLTGYIDKAKEKADLADARTAYMAAQTLFSETYGQGGYAGAVVEIEKINTLAGYAKNEKYTTANTKISINEKGVEWLEYYCDDGKHMVKFDKGEWTLNTIKK